MITITPELKTEIERIISDLDARLNARREASDKMVDEIVSKFLKMRSNKIGE